jgi:hypothetical protein
MKGVCKVVWKVINVKKRVHEAYKSGGNEAAYATYRAIMGVDARESWRVVKPWVRKWSK